MKAARRDRYGNADVIVVEDIEIPEPGAGEILVRVHASTVSRTDCALLAAKPFIVRFMTGLWSPKKSTLGTDYTGVVEKVGPGVERFSVGQAVWGMDDMGSESHAEYLVVNTTQSVFPKPEGLSFTEAAACIEGGWYAYSIVDRTNVTKGSRVLINGATGAIGSALLQMVADRDAKVTAVGNTKNLDLLRSLGASDVIDYEKENFIDRGGEYDFVFDAVGKSEYGACKSLLTKQGVYVSTELGPRWENPFLAMFTAKSSGRRVVFPFPIPRERYFEKIVPLVTQGRVKAVIDRTVILDDIADAYAYAASGQKTGTVVVKMA